MYFVLKKIREESLFCIYILNKQVRIKWERDYELQNLNYFFCLLNVFVMQTMMMMMMIILENVKFW